MCVSRGQAGFTVYDDRHWALEGSDLFYGDVIGGDLPLIGYESDGCRFQFGDDGLPKAVPMLGVPETLEIIGVAPCAFGEEAGRGYFPIIPPEKLDVVAEVMFGDSGPEAQAKVLARSCRRRQLQAREGRGVQQRHHRMGSWPGRARPVHRGYHPQRPAALWRHPRHPGLNRAVDTFHLKRRAPRQEGPFVMADVRTAPEWVAGSAARASLAAPHPGGARSVSRPWNAGRPASRPAAGDRRPSAA